MHRPAAWAAVPGGRGCTRYEGHSEPRLEPRARRSQGRARVPQVGDSQLPQYLGSSGTWDSRHPAQGGWKTRLRHTCVHAQRKARFVCDKNMSWHGVSCACVTMHARTSGGRRANTETPSFMACIICPRCSASTFAGTQTLGYARRPQRQECAAGESDHCVYRSSTWHSAVECVIWRYILLCSLL